MGYNKLDYQDKLRYGNKKNYIKMMYMSKTWYLPIIIIAPMFLVLSNNIAIYAALASYYAALTHLLRKKVKVWFK